MISILFAHKLRESTSARKSVSLNEVLFALSHYKVLSSGEPNVSPPSPQDAVCLGGDPIWRSCISPAGPAGSCRPSSCCRQHIKRSRGPSATVDFQLTDPPSARAARLHLLPATNSSRVSGCAQKSAIDRIPRKSITAFPFPLELCKT